MVKDKDERNIFQLLNNQCTCPNRRKRRLWKEAFYGELKSCIQECPKNDVKIIVGDLNAKIEQEEEYMLSIGKHSLHRDSNDSWTQLVHLAAALNMVIALSLIHI